MDSAAFKYFPQTVATTFAIYPSSDIPTFLWQQFSYIGTEPTYKYFDFKGQVQKNFLSVKG